MKTHWFNSVRNEEGSALLVSILLMSFVVVFGLGVSSLIVDSIRVERNVVEAGKSYFAAEAGVERALFFHENRLPGYESVETVELENGATMDYAMTALGEQIPCAHREGEWRGLWPQESLSIPLFLWDEDAGVRSDLSFFKVEYYVDRESNTWVNGYILRWKVLGLDDPGNHTEAISGVFDFSDDGFLNADTDTAAFYDLTGPPYAYFENEPLSTFLADHFLNYLVLTNVVDPTVQPTGETAEENNVIQLKVTVQDPTVPGTDDQQVACEYALVAADGLSGDTKQSIDVQIRMDTFLPVFNFVLYQTDTS